VTEGVNVAVKKIDEYLAENEMVRSMSRKGNPYDSPCTESFFTSLKMSGRIQIGIKDLKV
jgi:transposase InsO family protein